MKYSSLSEPNKSLASSSSWSPYPAAGLTGTTPNEFVLPAAPVVDAVLVLIAAGEAAVAAAGGALEEEETAAEDEEDEDEVSPPPSASASAPLDLEGWEEGAGRGEIVDLPPAPGARRNRPS